jgi:hypothetical protein
MRTTVALPITLVIYCFLIQVIQAQKAEKYTAYWHVVDSLNEAGLPASAKEKVIFIEKQAAADKQPWQQLKAIRTLVELESASGDEEGVGGRNLLLSFIAASKQTDLKASARERKILLAIASSWLAEWYEMYFDQHQYAVSQQSEITDATDLPIQAWTTSVFVDTIQYWYAQSLQEPEILQLSVDSIAILLSDYTQVGAAFQPTLFDLVAKKAMDFYINKSYLFTNKEESALVGSNSLFLSNPLFILSEPGSVMNATFSESAISLLKNTLRFSFSNQRKDALAYWDFTRLQFASTISTHPDKASLYSSGLDSLLASAAQSSFFSTVAYEKAKLMYLSSARPSQISAADGLCRMAIARYPQSPGAQQCRQLLHQQHLSSIRIETEEVVVPEIPFSFRLSTKEMGAVQLHLHHIDAAQFQSLLQQTNYGDLPVIPELQKPVWTISVQSESTSVNGEASHIGTIPGLRAGKYILLANSIADEGMQAAWTLFQVSDIAWSTFGHNKRQIIQFVHRQSGKPLPHTQAQMYSREFDMEARQFVSKQEVKMVSDKKGRITLSLPPYKQYFLTAIKGKDTLILTDALHFGYANEGQSLLTVQMMTDRTIYRPGQTVYYKGILIQKDKAGIPAIVPSRKVKLEWVDANSQVISTFEATTNEFGTIEGSMMIPERRLTGTYSLVITGDQLYSAHIVQVEEYKRPSYAVDMLPNKDCFQLDNEATVTVSARTFAGVPLQGARISYTVTRSTGSHYYQGRGGRGMPYNQVDKVLDRGQIFTDNEGQAVIAFVAARDAALDSASYPVFYFSVDIVVVDSRGETHTANAMVAAGYSPYHWITTPLSVRDVADNDSFQIEAKNWNWQAVSVPSQLAIYRIQVPDQVLKPYVWTDKVSPYPGKTHAAGQPVDKLYPLLDALPVQELVYASQYISGTAHPFPTHLGPGVYRIVVTDTVISGQRPVVTQYRVVTDFMNKQFPVVHHLYSRVSQQEAQPGDKVILSLGVSKAPVWANIVIYQGSRILVDTVMKVRCTTHIPVSITKSELGGVGIHIAYVKNNQFFTVKYAIDVPWTNKMLKLQVAGLRDKTWPGKPNTFTIKVSGLPASEKAELLACMYDASLDQFAQNQWNMIGYPNLTGWFEVRGAGMGPALASAAFWPPFLDTTQYEDIRIPMLRGVQMEAFNPVYMQRMAQSPMEAEVGASQTADARKQSDSQPVPPSTPENGKSSINPPVRKNLRETAFFLPRLMTDTTGTSTFSFTMNEALTSWKFRVFAHTKQYSTGYLEKLTETSLPLMVFPQLPRYLRERDTLLILGRIENRTDAIKKGMARLQFFTLDTNEEISAKLIQGEGAHPFEASPSESTIVAWEVVVPSGKWNALTWRMTAGDGAFEDGEENTLAVISSKVLVTESLPVTVAPGAGKEVVFDTFLKQQSPTHQDVRFVLEFTGHPVWYAIQALPYVHYQADISSIGLADKLFVNQLGRQIVSDNPRIESVLAAWKQQGEARLSPLQKNLELKSAIIEETPWVMDAMDETAARHDIALLLDQNQLEQEKHSLLDQLRQRQIAGGGIAWLPNSSPDVYTTLYLLEKIGQLHHLGILTHDDPEWASIAENALRFADRLMAVKYTRLVEAIKKYGGNLNEDHLDGQVIHWLYVRSFFQHVTLHPEAVEARKYYVGQIQSFWLKQRRFDQVLAGFVLFRSGIDSWRSVVQSLRETAIHHPELGMYWPGSNYRSWNDWPLEQHSLITLLLIETGSNPGEIASLQTWLLRNKQTANWQTPKATIMAIYALLLSHDSTHPSHLLTSAEKPVIKIDGKQLEEPKGGAEAGTSYTKYSWLGSDITPSLGKVHIENPGKSTSWGSLYYQYMEEEAAVTSGKGKGLQLEAKWYCKKSARQGMRLVPLDSLSHLVKGDVMVLRLQLTTDRHMEYLHLKAANPSCCEPVEVLSGYRYQGKTSYYLSVKDASAHFYLPSLEKGTYIFEHEVKIQQAGIFQVGVATVECLYAPEFKSRTSSRRILVK